MPTSRFAEFNLDPALAEAAESAPDQVIEGIIRLEDPAQIPAEFHVVCQFTRVCTGRFLSEHTWAIRQHPNVVSLKAARPLGMFQNDDSAELANSSAVLWRTGRPLPFTGRGCIIAALDFGLDFGHPNFLNRDGTTRVVSFWHQGATYDVAHPNRYGYGRVFSPDDINGALQTSDPYETLGYHPAISDTGNGSHGTHTLDIAAGNGRAPGSVSGIAPEAALIFVHLSTPRLGVVGDLGDSVRMLEALDFVHRTAGDHPWVVNISVGREAGSHDATSPFEQAMHELLRMGHGTNRAICQSAGNYGSADLAVHGWLRDGEQRDLEWIVHPSDIGPEIDAWYSGNDRFVVVLLPPDGANPVEVKLGEDGDIRRNGALIGRIYHRMNDPNNRDNHVEVFLYRDAPAGVWILRLIGDYVITGRFHAWIERAIPGAQSRFDRKITSRRYTLGTIATSPLVITVGAYDGNAEGHPLAPFSSCGPTRDERQDKPELLAPGVRVVAARSIPRDAVRQDGLLIPRSGTSMATPHVTGLVAAMFEAAGRPVSISEIRDCLKQSAEPVTDAEHPNCCAWGRVNAAEAISRVHDLKGHELISAPQWNASFPSSWITASETAVADADLEIAASEEPREVERIELPRNEGEPMDSDLGNRFLDRAEQALRNSDGGRRQSESSFLLQLMRDLGLQVFAPGLSPASLLRAAVQDRSLMPSAQNLLRVVALPLNQPEIPLRAGDWMLRAAPGTGDVGHVSVLASDDLLTPSGLAYQGIAAEGAQPGYYGTVIEGGAYPHSRKEPFARRFLDSRGRVPAQTVILRPQSQESDSSEENRPPAWLKIEQRTPRGSREPYLDFDAADFTIANEGEELPDRVVHVRINDLAHPLGSVAILRKVAEIYAKIGITVDVQFGSFVEENFRNRRDNIQITILSPNIDGEDEKAIQDTFVNQGYKNPVQEVTTTVSVLRGNATGFASGYSADPLAKLIFVKEITPRMRSQILMSFSLMYSNPDEAAQAVDVYFYADTLIHELGHNFGLVHTSDTGNYMYAPPAGQPQYDRLTDVVGRPGARQLMNDPSKWGAWVKDELSHSERSFTQDQIRTMRATLERFLPSPATGAARQPKVQESESWSEDQEPASDKFTPPSWLKIQKRTRSRPRQAESPDSEDFTFEPTGAQPDFGSSLRQAWHAMIQAAFKLNIDNVTSNIAAALMITDAAAAKNLRFFSPASRPPAITLTGANIRWRALPTSFGSASPALYEFVDEPRSQGGRMLRIQDEYCEWKVIRDKAKKILRVIFTSEPPEYYQFLYDPGVPSLTKSSRDLLVKLYQERCDDKSVTLADLEQTIGGIKTYNSGNRWNNLHCVHLQQPNNTLGAQINIAARAAVVRSNSKGTLITDVKKLIGCDGFGDPDRQSDPAIGDNVNKLARENRFLTLENPVGLYMTSLDTSGWTTPDGADAQDFWTVLKGKKDKDPGKSMIVRAEYAVPPAKGYTISDMKIAGDPIKFGAQIAEHLEMRLGGLFGPKDTDLNGGKLSAPTALVC